MRLLIVTQTVDTQNPVLGFFVSWIKAFSEHAEVSVVCLSKGEYDLRGVSVHSLGKEEGRQPSFVYAFRFLSYIWRTRNKYDAVFVHMNAEYLILAGALWKLLGKRVGLWYTHGTLSFPLRVGSLFTDHIFTASEKSLPLHTPKRRVMGHGIDTDFFTQLPVPEGPFRAVTVSRIAPVKKLELLINSSLKTPDGILTIIGAPATESDRMYDIALQALARAGGNRIVFAGPRSITEIQEELAKSHLFLHASATGSLDKAPLEALSSGVPVITTNSEYAGTEAVTVVAATPEAFTEAITAATKNQAWAREEVRTAAHTYIRTRHSLPVLIGRLVSILAGKATEEELATHFNQVGQDTYETNRWEANERTKGQYEATERYIATKVIPTLSSDRIVELGPGPGTWTKLLHAARPTARFVLLDISQEMLARAEAALPKDATVETREGDFLSVPVREGETQFFFSSRALEYVSDKKKAVARIYTLLAPKGEGCVITKMPKPLMNGVLGRRQSTRHQGQISPKKLVRLLREAGFVDVRVYPVTFAVPLLKSAGADRFAWALLHFSPLTPLSAFFAESYGVQFRKP